MSCIQSFGLFRSERVEILQSNGFEEVRSGKHATLKRRVGDRVLATWVPRHGKVSVFMIEYIIKQPEKPRSGFA